MATLLYAVADLPNKTHIVRIDATNYLLESHYISLSTFSLAGGYGIAHYGKSEYGTGTIPAVLSPNNPQGSIVMQP